MHDLKETLWFGLESNLMFTPFTLTLAKKLE